jgi:hypothetical protein
MDGKKTSLRLQKLQENRGKIKREFAPIKSRNSEIAKKPYLTHAPGGMRSVPGSPFTRRSPGDGTTVPSLDPAFVPGSPVASPTL